MGKILMVYSSKHGATKDIANTIAAQLTKAGHELHVFDKPLSAPHPVGFQTVILGSAVYLGNWRKSMKNYCTRNMNLLAAAPNVWLFSSGPVGEQDMLLYNKPVPVELLQKTLAVKDHAVFYGKLDTDNLSLIERATTKMVKAGEGDFRDWEAIAAWTSEITQSVEKLNSAKKVSTKRPEKTKNKSKQASS